MDARKIYHNIPMPLLKLGFSLIPYAWVVGKNYTATRKLCRYLDAASQEEVTAYQEKKLSEILLYAVNHVPFYRKYRQQVETSRSAVEALKHFPAISKEDVQAHFDELTSDQIDEIPHLTARTGGSSGNQLAFYQDNRIFSIELGFMHSLWERVGYSPVFRKATFRGVVFPNLKPGVFWQHNPIHNELQFSPFLMSEQNLPAYIEQLCKYRPRFLHGYPSALTILADYVIRHDLTGRMPEISAALCGSEPCSPAQREKMEKAFNTRVYTWFGHSERVILAGECEDSTDYHALPGYGYLEMLKSDGGACAQGEFGELVGTGFWNRSMPLIRYRTGDFATRKGNVCSCGRHCALFGGVEGRWNISGVIGKSGTRISAAAINIHESIFDHVKRFQYYQDEVGKLEILIVPSPDFSEQERQKILVTHKKKFGDELDITVKMVDDIPLTSSGKFMTIRLGYKPQDISGISNL